MPAALAPSRARGEGCWHCSSPCGAWVPAPSPGTRAGERAASPCPVTTRLSGPFRPARGVGQRESRQPFSHQGAASAGSRSEATEASCPLQPVEELVRKRGGAEPGKGTAAVCWGSQSNGSDGPAAGTRPRGCAAGGTDPESRGWEISRCSGPALGAPSFLRVRPRWWGLARAPVIRLLG